MKKAVITGANSFIGYRLCRCLSQNGWFVYAVIRKDNANNIVLRKEKNIKIIYSSMKDYDKLDEFIDESCDVGITLAWNGTRGEDRNDVEKQKENFVFSLNCFNTFYRLGCKKIITAGSQAEYGLWTESRKVTETDICKPNTEYGKYKLELYKKAYAFCSEKNITLIEPRFFSLYGDDDSEKTMIIQMVRNMLQNKPCELTQGVQLWDFLYVDDAIEGLNKLIESPSAEGIYNFGSGISKPLKEYVLEMAKIVKTQSSLIFGAIPYPKSGIVHTNPAIDKLCRDAFWKPSICFEEGIKKVIQRQKHILNNISNA